MAATAVKDLIVQVRNQLVEPTPRFWSDAELKSIMQNGVTDLWGAIIDLHQDHYIKVDAVNPVLKANTTEIYGIQDDCFRVQLIEPASTLVTAAGHSVIFVPRKYNHPDFVIARTLDAQDPSSLPSRQIYFQVTGVGAPGEPPHILTAPLLNADLPLRIAYNPTIVLQDLNPIPGGSDNALKAWTIAYARAKDNPERQPDSGWLATYATEKQLLLTRLTPRQEQEPDVVEDMFQGYGSLW